MGCYWLVVFCAGFWLFVLFIVEPVVGYLMILLCLWWFVCCCVDIDCVFDLIGLIRVLCRLLIVLCAMLGFLFVGNICVKYALICWKCYSCACLVWVWMPIMFVVCY